MNRYLTEQAERGRRWDLPVGILSAILTAISIEVWTEDSPVGEDFAIWLMAHLVVTALMVLPLYRIARWRLRQRKARLIADRLLKCGRTRIPLVEADKALGIWRSVEHITRLTRQGFLQNIDMDDGFNLVLADPEPVEAPNDAAQAPEVPEAPDDVITQIRRLNDEIDDKAVSESIDRMERVTGSILRTSRERPERADEARRFMDYYLPTTLKLLESYRLMEKQSFQGENIQKARAQIEEVLDKLVTAAERQHDKLYGPEALDVEAEIQVLETMMASDGLIGERTGKF